MKKTKLLVTTLVSVLATCGCNNEVSSSTSSQASNSIVSTSSTSNLVTYKMNIMAINGKALKNVTVKIYNESDLVETLKSDFYGRAEITLVRGDYTAKLEDLPEGMYSEDTFILKEGEENNLACYANPIEGAVPNGTLYNVGDLVYNFSFINTNGEKVKLSTLLENKKGVILNFWGTTCVPCQEEFPYIEQLHNSYKDQVEIVALSVEDSITSVVNFQLDNEYTFTMGVDIGKSVFKPFLGYFGNPSTGSYSIPATAFIDKYGFINRLNAGSYIDYGTLESNCLEMINKYEKVIVE